MLFLTFNKVSTGRANDKKKATAIQKYIITNLLESDRLFYLFHSPIHLNFREKRFSLS